MRADAQAVDAALEGRREIGCRLRDRRRVAGVVPADHLDGEGGVGHRRGERADLVERRGEGDESQPADHPVGGLHPDDAAQRGRLADRPTGVAAERHGGEPGRHRGGAAAARSAGHPGRIVGVAGRPEGGVLGARPHGELVEVGLADQHGAGGGEARHHRGVVGRPPALEDPRRARGGDPPRAHVVLEGHRHPGERARIPSGGDGVVDGGRGGAGRVGEHDVEGVQFVLAPGDGGEVLVDHVDGAALAGADRRGDVDRGGHVSPPAR